MRKPAHANPDAPTYGVSVFEAGKRHVLFDMTGKDPVTLARKVAADDRVPADEKKGIRTNVRNALKSLHEGTVPDTVTDMQMHVGARRVRVKSLPVYA